MQLNNTQCNSEWNHKC